MHEITIIEENHILWGFIFVEFCFIDGFGNIEKYIHEFEDVKSIEIYMFFVLNKISQIIFLKCSWICFLYISDYYQIGRFIHIINESFGMYVVEEVKGDFRLKFH